MQHGYLCLMLHAHLPYVRHPEYSDSFEEDWLYEAITETYLPLLKVFENLLSEGVDFHITMSLTPTLCEMLRDPLLVDRYEDHLEKLYELSEKEIERTKDDPCFNHLARMYNDIFKDALHRFKDVYKRDIVNAFANIQNSGKLEIITCGATHGFLPLMDTVPEAVRAQIHVGVKNYEKHFGKKPCGFWLPECGYMPGHDRFLSEAGIKFFFLDSHPVLFADPRPAFAVYAPVYTPYEVAAFARDPESSKQVWSSKEGYPGDYYYREFYRDVGYDLPLDYIGPYIHESGQRINTGIKYYRITGSGEYKEPYNPEIARDKAAEHAGNFMFNREKQAEYLHGVMGRQPIIVAPYDAELFGHWWFEGPMWIEYLAKKIHFDQENVKMITPVGYLEKYPENQVVQPSMGSWGYKGYCEVWLEGSNDWIYRHLLWCARKMVELADRFREPNNLELRALNQAARELLLAQSSDWAFIMKTGTHVEYARQRTENHITRFNRLYHEISEGKIDEGHLSHIESLDNLFSEIDYSIYRPVK
ncbi:MAG: DUF1957 domain-containing protein [Candidatus Eremiobacteraeota bacterium]|nr:DUF1957 domain-containing protein [Candidatus Eremiobacteraeota bacterium]